VSPAWEGSATIEKPQGCCIALVSLDQSGPDKTFRIILAAKPWGRSPAMGFIALAIRPPNAIAIIDDEGAATFEEVNRRSNALARGLRKSGISPGDFVREAIDVGESGASKDQL